jgi:hypothetical protein
VREAPIRGLEKDGFDSVALTLRSSMPEVGMLKAIWKRWTWLMRRPGRLMVYAVCGVRWGGEGKDE